MTGKRDLAGRRGRLDSIRTAITALLAGELEQLAELADHLVVAAFLEAGRHARRQWPSRSADSNALSARSTANDCLTMSTQYWSSSTILRMP